LVIESFTLVKFNLDSFFNPYEPINQFYRSVLMDCVKQSRKLWNEERNQEHNSLYWFDSRWIYVQSSPK